MTSSYMWILYFNHIHPYHPLLSLPLLLIPLSSQLVSLLHPPLSLIRVAYKNMDEGLSPDTWAPCQWLHH